MIRRTKPVPLLAMALVAAALGNTHEACAGAMGITITGSGAPVLGTDPIYNYTFDVSVAPGFSFSANDYVEFVMLPGINGSEPVVSNISPLAGWGYPVVTPTGSPSAGASSPYSPTNTYTSDLYWVYTGTQTFGSAHDNGKCSDRRFHYPDQR